MSGHGKGIVVRDAWCVFEHVSGRKVEALREVTLEIPAGQFVCIVGRSGHGKSTFLRALGGLNPLTRGEVFVDGVPVAGPSAERGMVFQDETVFPWMRVRANVEFGLRAQGMSAAERARDRPRLAAPGRAQRFRRAPGRASSPAACAGGSRSRPCSPAARRSS